MDQSTPRIETVSAEDATVLQIGWKDTSRTDRVDLAGWIGMGGEVLAPLNDPEIFKIVHIIDYGTAVAWNDDDLTIDAVHLELLATEQKPFGSREAAGWQKAMGLSDREAADFLRISLSTWNAYKANASIPSSIGMLCRAAQRDPILMHAHFRPHKTWRPPKRAEPEEEGGKTQTAD